MTDPLDDFRPIDINAVERIVQSYVIQRDRMVSFLHSDDTVSHSRFIQFCNDQSQILVHQVLGMGDVQRLSYVLLLARTGSIPMSTPKLDEGLRELIMCAIAYAGVMQARKADQN